jgi:hypothetical protein
MEAVDKKETWIDSDFGMHWQLRVVVASSYREAGVQIQNPVVVVAAEEQIRFRPVVVAEVQIRFPWPAVVQTPSLLPRVEAVQILRLDLPVVVAQIHRPVEEVEAQIHPHYFNR